MSAQDTFAGHRAQMRADAHATLVAAIEEALYECAAAGASGINVRRGEEKGCFGKADQSKCPDCYRVQRGDLRTPAQIAVDVERGHA